MPHPSDVRPVIDPPLALLPAPEVRMVQRGALEDWRDEATGELRGGWVVRDRPEAPRSPRGDRFRFLRSSHGIFTGDAARALGIETYELSRLERGELALSDADWTRAEAHLATLTPRTSPL